MRKSNIRDLPLSLVPAVGDRIVRHFGQTRLLKRLLLGCLACSFVLFTSKKVLIAQDYEVQGTMAYRFVVKTNGNVIIDQESDFSMSVNGCRWFLRTTPKKFIKRGKSQELPDYVVASTDLTNFYFLVSMETMGNASAKTNKVESSISGIIGNGIVPYVKDPVISLLWYALASGCYFQEQVTNDYIIGVISFRNPGYYSKDFRVKARWELEAATPHVPKSIIFSGNYKFLDDNPDPNFTERLNPTSCIYTALQFTNIGTLTLPKKGMAEFPTTSIFATTFEFLVTNVSERSSVNDFVVKIPGAALLSDYRPISAPVPMAVPTGPVKEWPKLATTKIAYQKLIRKQPSSPAASKNAVRVLFLLTTLLSTGAVLFCLLQNVRKNNKKPNQE